LDCWGRGSEGRGGGFRVLSGGGSTKISEKNLKKAAKILARKGGEVSGRGGLLLKKNVG